MNRVILIAKEDFATHCQKCNKQSSSHQPCHRNPLQIMLDKTCNQEQISKRPHRITMSHMETLSQWKVWYESQTDKSATNQKPKILLIGQLFDQ